MKTHSILRGRVQTAARRAALVLLGLAATGCGMSEMYDPAPVHSSRTQSRYRSTDPVAARRTYQPPPLTAGPLATPTVTPPAATPAMDDPFGPARATRATPPEGKHPDTAVASDRQTQDLTELERPRRPLVVIGKPSPSPATPSAVTPPQQMQPTPAAPPETPVESSRPQAIAKADPVEVQPSLVARPPDVQTAPSAPRVRTTKAPATKPVESASAGSAEKVPAETVRPAEAVPAAPPEANVQPRVLTPEQIKLRARVAQLKEQLKKGNEVDERDDRGRTLLQQAAITGELEVAETLLDSGANLKAQDSQGWTALHWAASSGHPEICELLIASGASIDAKGWVGDTPLYWAATFDRHDVAELLLARGANVNATDKQGRTALHAAVEADAVATVKVLLDHQADLTSRDAAGASPLHLAVFQCRKAVSEAVRGDSSADSPEASQASARIGSADREKARRKALDRGCNMVRLLLAKGAQVNVASDRGITPLHLAAWDEMSPVAELLLAAGANPKAKDLQDRTPIEYAKVRKQKDAEKLLTASARGH